MSSSQNTPPEAPQVLLSRGRELELERLKNQKLARELTRIAFEKEVLLEQVTQLKSQATQANQAPQNVTPQVTQLDMSELAQAILEDLRREIGDVEARLRNQLGGQIENQISDLSDDIRAQLSAVVETKCSAIAQAAAAAAGAANQTKAVAQISAVGSPNTVQTLIVQTPSAQTIVAAPIPETPKPQVKPPPRPASLNTSRSEAPSAPAAPAAPEKIEALELANQLHAFNGARAANRTEELRRQIAAERIQFRKLAANFLKEIEFIKKVHPLRALLKSKEVELTRVKKIIQNVPRNHPERPQMENLIQAHDTERREIAMNLRQMETTLAEQTKQINEAIQSADPNDLSEI